MEVLILATVGTAGLLHISYYLDWKRYQTLKDLDSNPPDKLCYFLQGPLTLQHLFLVASFFNPRVLVIQYLSGGHVIAFQVEKEYGSFDKHKHYMPYLYQVRTLAVYPHLHAYFLNLSFSSTNFWFPTWRSLSEALCISKISKIKLNFFMNW